MKILTEASGSLTAAYLFKAIQEAGHQSVGSDIDRFNAGACLSDEFVVLPPKNAPDLWPNVEKKMQAIGVEAVIPSLDETMLDWAQRKEYFQKQGIYVIISPRDTIRVCQDKWETYLFFKQADIPCPSTSLEQDFPLVKPRSGRGAEGVMITGDNVNMAGLISQQVAEGEEYTVDTFFDRNGTPVYIVPRKRIEVKNGKSTRGIVCQHKKIEHYIRNMARKMLFIGPINFQCFDKGGDISFIEINPRIAGGMALGFAATENWITLMVEHLILGRPIQPKQVQYGLKMVRYYAECFIP